MKTLRVAILFAVALTLGVLAVVFARSDDSRTLQIAAVVSALSGVIAAGAAIWQLVDRRSAGVASGISIERTGNAKSGSGGKATSGVVLSARSESAQPVRINKTGNADASRGGKATSGLDDSDE